MNNVSRSFRVLRHLPISVWRVVAVLPTFITLTQAPIAYSQGTPNFITKFNSSGSPAANSILFDNHPFYQFTQPSVAASLCSGNPLNFFDSFSVRLLQEQGPQNATRGDRDSSPGAPPNARAGDPTGPSPAAHRPPRWLSTATRPTRPN